MNRPNPRNFAPNTHEPVQSLKQSFSQRPLVRGWRQGTYDIIFESNTFGGKLFDLCLLAMILLSLLVVTMESIQTMNARYGNWLLRIEWAVVVVFSMEYALRIWCVRNPWRYIRSVYGIIDLLSILPVYISILVPGAQSFVVLRVLRFMRIFRVLKLAHFLAEGAVLGRALRASVPKIVVFLTAVLGLIIFVGALMYWLEGKQNGFDNIPVGMYWAVVTLTTVGYGDVVPITPFGRFAASLVMVMGYGVIAVPTGILTSELRNIKAESPQVPLVMVVDTSIPPCLHCHANEHAGGSRFCRLCGSALFLKK